MAEPYDVAIFGATPAGWAAARALATRKRRTVVVRTADDDTRCNLCDWAGQGLFRATMLGKAMATKSGAKEFKKVCYHNAELTRQVHNRSRTRSGWFVRADNLVKALGDDARSAGVKLWSPRTQPTVHLEENGVRLVAGRTTRARVLIIACKRPGDIAAELSLPMRTTAKSSLVVAALDIPQRGKAEKLRRGDSVLHVVESAEKGELGMFFTLDGTLHVRLICPSRKSNAAARLSRMITRLDGANLLGEQLDVDHAAGGIWRPPAGIALELESHVAKRCLLVGTAGGFADATTGQTLSASVQSALLGARAADRALDSTDCQSALMHFKDSWRNSLANFIRPPNTSLQLLLPLLFTNDRITTRFTAALLNGKNI